MATSFHCAICMDTINKNKAVKCQFCDFVGCNTCVRESLLYSVNDPQCPCPDCKHTWSYEFCLDNLTKSFMNGPFRERRRKILFEIEKSKFPATMEIIQRMNKEEELKEQEKALRAVIQNLREQEKHYQELIEQTVRKRWQLSIPKKEKKVFKKKCPSQDCSGFLSEDHTCPICKCKVCKDCNDIISDPSVGESKHQHVCNPDIVASLKFIRKDTKQCPGCQTSIHKIDGCDQMWCTHCKIPFSWKTGEKVTGTIHNPHFYEWRKNNNEIQRNVGEILCGGVVDFDIINNLVIMSNNFKSAIGSKYNYKDKQKNMEKILTKKTRYFVLPIFKTAGCQHTFITYLYDMHRQITHFQHMVLDSMRRKCEDRDFLEKSRIEYIRGNINEKSFKLRIIRNDNTRRKNTMILHIFEMLYVTYLETYNDLVAYLDNLSRKELNIEDYRQYYLNNKKIFDNTQKKMFDSLKRMENLVSYANKQLWRISKLLNLSVPFVYFPYTTNKKYDDEDFQLYITENNKNKKVVGEEQNEYFKDSKWFNHSLQYSYWSDRQDMWIYRDVYKLFKNQSKSILV